RGHPRLGTGDPGSPAVGSGLLLPALPSGHRLRRHAWSQGAQPQGLQRSRGAAGAGLVLRVHRPLVHSGLELLPGLLPVPPGGHCPGRLPPRTAGQRQQRRCSGSRQAGRSAGRCRLGNRPAQVTAHRGVAHPRYPWRAGTEQRRRTGARQPGSGCAAPAQGPCPKHCQSRYFMSKPVKRVLLTNDDGWRGPGFQVLEEIAHEIAEEVWLVSPDLDQSGVSMSISVHHPLRVHQFEERRFSVSGTPSDCILLGVAELLPAKPDLILSGVNRGANISDSVAYSGTIGGALTGTLLGIPAIALSQAYHSTNPVHWETSRQYGAQLVRELLERGWPEDCAMNINFPALAPEDVRGVAICRPQRG